MAARRVRIKGIANIPARRKNDTTNTDKNNEDSLLLKTDCKGDKNNTTLKNLVSDATDTNNVQKENKNEREVKEQHQEPNLSEFDIQNNIISKETKDQNTNENNQDTTEISTPLATKTESKLSRRWVSKPSVKIPAVPRRTKPLIEESNDKLTELKSSNIISTEPIIKENISVPPSKTLDIAVPEISIKNTSNENVKNSNSDNNLICPLSPNKTVNRARIRPIPRFIRRNSVQGSASESEDDGRKSTNRTRNDSVCSVSNIEGNVKDDNNTKEKQNKIPMQRKIRYTDQSRKLATARREFNIKFGAQSPDRRRLTMMDLIFYNPTTNPMPEKPTRKNSVEIIKKINHEEEEKEDDPDEISDAENIPVPQVKVGPDGEIILDEQSLVIEQTGAKKAREQIENSQIVIDDLDTGYGIYKRPKKCKDWSINETLRFYRTLNTVGTDFSLMLSLFPGRTRRDLKLKFKKEERNNRMLIDKALMNPLDFNLTELEEQLQDEQSNAIFKKKPDIKEAMPKKRKKYHNSSLLSREIDDENEIKVKRKKIEKKDKDDKSKNKSYCVLQKGIESLIDSSESEDESASIIKNNNIEIDNIPLLRPTRTCRLKNPNNYEALLESDESEIEEINLAEDNDNSEEHLDGTEIVEKKIKTLENKPQKKNCKNTKHKVHKSITKKPEPMALEDLDLEINENDVMDTTIEEPLEPQIETNIVIAHSENEEPDKISIDIVSKNNNEKGSSSTETKVSLEIKKHGQNLLQIENIQNNTCLESIKTNITNTANESEEFTVPDNNICNESMQTDNPDDIRAEKNLILNNNSCIESIQTNTLNDDNILEELVVPDCLEPIKTNIRKEMVISDKNTSLERKQTNILKEMDISDKNTKPPLPKMEPGSLMILSSLDPNGEKVYKVFMISPNNENIPINLSADVVKSLTNSLGSDEEITLDLPVATKDS